MGLKKSYLFVHCTDTPALRADIKHSHWWNTVLQTILIGVHRAKNALDGESNDFITGFKTTH